MKPSEKIPSDQKPRQTEQGKRFFRQSSVQRSVGSRFYSCLVIATVFILLDLAILFYFLWPLTPAEDVEQVSPAPAGIENEINESAPTDGLQR